MKGVVRFEKVVSTRKVRSLEQALEADTWYTQSDFNKIRQREKRLSFSLAKAAREGRLEGSRIQFHGVETSDERAERRQRMSKASNSVLLEQENIWDSEEQEEEEEAASGCANRDRKSTSSSRRLSAASRIALAYSSYSIEATRLAAARATKNAEDVLEVYCNIRPSPGIVSRTRSFASTRWEATSSTGSNSSSDENVSPRPRQTSPTVRLSSRSIKRQFLKGFLHRR